MILSAGSAVVRVPFPGGAIDVDTPADYERLTEGFTKEQTS